MSNGEYPVEPEVAVALLRLERKIVERLFELERKVDALAPAKPAATTRTGATAGAIAAGAVLGLVEGLRRFIGS